MNCVFGSFRSVRSSLPVLWRSTNTSSLRFQSLPISSSFSSSSLSFRNASFLFTSSRTPRSFPSKLSNSPMPFSSSLLSRWSSSSLTPSLDSIVKIELLEKETPEKIEEIWLEYFKDKSNISAVIPSECYQNLRARFAHCPIFVLPWEQPNGKCVPVFFMVKENTHCYTLVSDLKENPDTCPPQLLVHWFSDLHESKDIILLKGDLVGPVFSAADGQYLVGITQIFYLNDEWYEKYVIPCNHDPDKFVYDDVVKLLFQLGENTGENSGDKEGNGEEEEEEMEDGIVLSVEDLFKMEKDMKESNGEVGGEKKKSETQSKSESSQKKK